MTETDRKAAFNALDDIVTAYCMSLGMDPPVPDPESQTSKQVALICAALKTPQSLSDEYISECRAMIKEKTGLEAAFFDDLIALLIEKASASALPKMQKVDLDGMKKGGFGGAAWDNGYIHGYNRAIDDIKSKYGELYFVERK